MPVHDWTRVRAGSLQDFRSSWICALSAVLNRGSLPGRYYALMAPAAVSPHEILAPPGTLPFREPWREAPTDDELEYYRLRKSHVVVRSANDHRAIAVVDVLSAGDKASSPATTAFAEKTLGLLDLGVNVLLVDLLPPGPWDPQGIHDTIWRRLTGEPFEHQSDKPLTLVDYSGGVTRTAYLEQIAVGDPLPDMPIFLAADHYVLCPLEATYHTAWNAFPAALKPPLERPAGG